MTLIEGRAKQGENQPPASTETASKSLRWTCELSSEQVDILDGYKQAADRAGATYQIVEPKNTYTHHRSGRDLKVPVGKMVIVVSFDSYSVYSNFIDVKDALQVDQQR